MRPPPSLPKPATDGSLAEKPFLRPFFTRGGLRFPVSARRHRLQAPFGAPVSGGKNPVPNSTSQESAGGGDGSWRGGRRVVVSGRPNEVHVALDRKTRNPQLIARKQNGRFCRHFSREVVSYFRSLRADIIFRPLLARQSPAAKIPFQIRRGRALIRIRSVSGTPHAHFGSHIEPGSLVATPHAIT